MAETKPQTLANHRRFDPLFHFIVAPLVLLIFFHSLLLIVHHHDPTSVTVLAMSIALILMLVLVRTYPLKVQDRLIRLEERLRLMTVLPPLLHHRIAELSESQLVALRFASDKELMALTARVLEEKLDAKQIKAAIVEWRPDYFRV